jgi:hypothetical protein
VLILAKEERHALGNATGGRANTCAGLVAAADHPAVPTTPKSTRTDALITHPGREAASRGELLRWHHSEAENGGTDLEA